MLPNKQGPFLASAVILVGFVCNLLADCLESEHAQCKVT
jgi:hypothetical protein